MYRTRGFLFRFLALGRCRLQDPLGPFGAGVKPGEPTTSPRVQVRNILLFMFFWELETSTFLYLDPLDSFGLTVEVFIVVEWRLQITARGNLAG